MDWIAASIVYCIFFAGAFVRPKLWWLGTWTAVCAIPVYQLSKFSETDAFNYELVFAGAVYGFFLGILVQVYRLGIAWKSNSELERWPLVLGLVGPVQILVDFI